MTKRKKTLIIDNSKDHAILDGGPWVARYCKKPYEIRSGIEVNAPIDPTPYARLIITGSEDSVLDPIPWMELQIQTILEAERKNIPMLGICLGHQLLGKALSKEKSVAPAKVSELGWLEITHDGSCPLMKGIPERFFNFCSHFDAVTKLPPDFISFAETPGCKVQGMVHKTKPIFGIQFHPEVDAPGGVGLINAFLKDDFNGVLQAQPIDSDIAPTLFANFEALS